MAPLLSMRGSRAGRPTFADVCAAAAGEDMDTAVLCRELREDIETHIVFGAPTSAISIAFGAVALFPADRIVAYLVRANRRARLYVFRTLDNPEPFSAEVPGVRPLVRLLMEAHTGRRI